MSGQAPRIGKGFTDARIQAAVIMSPSSPASGNPNHHRAILAITTAFWDSYLRDDAEAKKWLDSDAVRGVLEKADQWQKK